VSDPLNGNIPVVLKRRRTHRHRRNRRVRRSLGAAVLAICIVTFSAYALQHISPSLFSGGQSPLVSVNSPVLSFNQASMLDQILSNARPSRPVYPYSIVPGGVEDAKELKWVAEHDPIVGAHYAGFNYARAQVVQLTLARTVYLSYRIGTHVYWTRRRITLHKGEKLITDGKMTARSRCGNRVEETPQQQALSPAEPPAERFDEPIRAGEGIAKQAGAPFDSAFLNRPQMPGLEPVAPLNLYDPFVGGSFIPLSPPPLPAGLCSPLKSKGTGPSAVAVTGKNKTPISCKAVTPEIVPEPGTWVLFASGLAAIGWLSRTRFSHA